MIGILGGTFDPIHYGHLRPALEVREALGLDEILFIPLRTPAHRDAPRVEGGQRLALIQAAVREQAGFRVDDRELRRDGVSYTVVTLRSLRAEQPERTLCLLMGQHAFLEFPTWHRPREILELAHLVVMRRPDSAAALSPALREIVAGRQVADAGELDRVRAGRILFQPVTQLEISATRIRDIIGRGASPRYLLPDAVLELVLAQGLYRRDA